MVDVLPGLATTAPVSLYIGPSHHDFDWLPEPAVSRLTELSQRVQDLHRQIPDSVDIIELGRAATSHQARIAQLTKARGIGGFGLGELAPEVVTEKRKLDKVIAEKDRLQQLVTARSDKWTVVAQLERRVHEFLRDKNGRLDVAAELPIDKLLVNHETIATALTRYRSKQADLAQKLQRVRSAPWPSRVAIERATKQIAAMSAPPDVANAIDYGEPVNFQIATLSSIIRGEAPALAHTETVNVLGLFCWMFERELTAKITATISQHTRDSEALDEAQRATQEADLIGKTLDCERAECALIRHAEAQGETIDYRRDVSVEAVLGVAVKATRR